MANATDIIKDAIQDLGRLMSGKEPDTNDLTDGLRKLNAMLETMSTSSLLVPFRTEVTHTLSGAQSYTIGPSGDINAVRPMFIDSAFIRIGGTDHTVHVSRDRTKYDRISDKDTTGRPYFLYYEPSVPLGRVFVYPAGASGTLHMNTRGQLTAFPDATTEVDLAPGYYNMIYTNFALKFAASRELTPSPSLIREAQQSKVAIKRLNRQSPVMQFDYGIPTGRSYYDIEAG